MKPLISGSEVFQQLSDDLKAKISSLPKEKVLAVYMRNTSTDDNKVQVEFAEKINLSTQPQSALAAFNPGDERFSSGARRTWITADRVYAENMFKVSIKDNEAFAEIGQVLNPINGGTQELRIQVREFLESEMTDSQREYADNYLKRIPSTGAYFYAKNGERVCAETRLVIVDRVWDEIANTYVSGNPGHILIEGEYKTATTTSAASILQAAGTSPKLVS
jgi:hypothetical protein